MLIRLTGDTHDLTSAGVGRRSDFAILLFRDRNLKRTLASEWMDRSGADPARVAESLDDLAWLNRYLGGAATVLYGLNALLAQSGIRHLRVLDVAAGGGDILGAVTRWWRRHGGTISAVASDRGRVVTREAERRLLDREVGGVRVVRCDARALSFADSSFDVAICSTFLHHLEPGDSIAVLLELARVSALGIVVSDLRRSIPGYLAARALAATLWRRHPYTRHDGPASMRSAYSLAEVRRLAERAGLDATVDPQPLFRWMLRWRRDA